jgi:hypothetical protein
MAKSKKISHTLAGVSGEYFVAAELSRRGYICSVTLKNTKGIDILVCNEDAKKTLGIQVKTNQINKSELVLSEKNEKLIDPNICYVLVNLKEGGELPDFYIIPSKVVANYISNDHKNWLSKKGSKGQDRKDNNLRKFRDSEKKYLGRWDLLGI